ncbi:DNA-binding protein [Halobaculum roseum]|uniref:DNA-binding protein n=1 Tax=Halobaculum roseum TaxID=2175149 RepID=A0ABD5MQ91_9EURY|nr:DNA-binding protein [Halobaculum roseum]QZY04582.1 DNA-binding protein [Halobaculum roseum]
MSSGSDPTAVIAALDRAQDAFEMVGRGRTEFEDGIRADEDWKTQLTKACRLLAVVDTLQSQNGYYTAVIEVCFGTIERSIEAYALSMTNDTLQAFQDHQFSYERAHQIGLFEKETAEEMKNLYSENRTESYYGGGRPTEEQAEAMTELAIAVHQFAVSQIREGGVCLCD